MYTLYVCIFSGYFGFSLFTNSCHFYALHSVTCQVFSANSLPGLAAGVDYGLRGNLANPVSLSELFNIPLPQIISLMSPESVWVKEQLYYNNSQSHSPMNVSLSNLTGHTYSVLQGYDVSMTQYKSLASPVLKQTLLNHPPFKESEVGKKVLKRNQQQKTKQSNADGSAMSDQQNMNNTLASALKRSIPNGALMGEEGGAVRKKVKRDRLFDALAIMQAEMDQNASKCLPQINGESPHNDNVDESMIKGAKEEESKMTDDDDLGPYSSGIVFCRYDLYAIRI